MTDAVTHHADSVTHHAIPDAADKASNRRKQVREANVRYRARRRDGRMRLVVELNRKQLDALEERGYLLRDLRTAKQSIQDQQKQIRGQHNRRHARYRKH
jgi:hypothetical protein